MSLVSIMFSVFVTVALLLYYLLPRKAQSAVLFGMSVLFYLSYGIQPVLFLVFAVGVTYTAAVRMGALYEAAGNEEDRRAAMASAKKSSRRILIIAMLLNFGMLAFLKYTNFFIDNINGVLSAGLPHLKLLLPLGISYYTFQSVGYLLDVYWQRSRCENNLFRLALFLVFFPYMVQGPISRYGQLAGQLYENHDFDWANIHRGLLRILWGLFKMMVLAEWASVYREAIFADPDGLAGIALFGVLLYTVELYGNFSGGIDIVLGVASMFSIRMEENFRQPFFSVSITDFWQRWHITQGSWMRDYVFYPLTLSGFMKKFGKKTKKAFGKKVGRTIPVCLANLIVFFLVGVWHGPTWGNIGWGIYNGVIIAFSVLMENRYKIWKKALHINDKSKGWHLFMILRTFALINISWYFDCVTSLSKALKMMRYSVTAFDPSLFLTIPAGKLGTDFTPYALGILLGGCLILFCVSLWKERGADPEADVLKAPVALQVLLFLLLLLAVLALGPQSAGRGFIYAQF
ncbi:MAG: MBOAT family protein [Firmicutes bacterium]|nr:MBOAT family protein [Bacillota bacterium]